MKPITNIEQIQRDEQGFNHKDTEEVHLMCQQNFLIEDLSQAKLIKISDTVKVVVR